jgi:hypothetical protein
MKIKEFQRLTITIDELSHALGIRKHAILQFRAGVRQHPLLRGLPEPAACRPRLIWWSKDIEAWVESRRTFSSPASQNPTDEPPRPPRGRPRKYPPAGEGGAE